MKNKKRQDKFEKEINGLSYEIMDALINQPEILKKFQKCMDLTMEEKLSENILANNNCLEDFSEKVKKEFHEDPWVGEYKSHISFLINKIKNEMKLKGGGS